MPEATSYLRAQWSFAHQALAGNEHSESFGEISSQLLDYPQLVENPHYTNNALNARFFLHGQQLLFALNAPAVAA